MPAVCGSRREVGAAKWAGSRDDAFFFAYCRLVVGVNFLLVCRVAKKKVPKRLGATLMRGPRGSGARLRLSAG